MISGLTITIVILAIQSLAITAQDACKYTDPQKGTLDISSLAGKDGRAAFPDQIPPTGSNYKYSYNPCQPFSEGLCQNVAACQVSMDGLFTFSIGLHSTARWESGAGLGSNPTVIYTSGEKTTRVTLECKRTGPVEFEALGEEPMNNYKFRLASLCSCWDGCNGGPGPQTTTSSGGGGGGGGGGGSSIGGTLFVVFLLVFIFVYFVGFAVFYRVREQKTGADLIAHRTFWVALPGYAKDGVVYVYRRVSNKGADPYSSV